MGAFSTLYVSRDAAMLKLAQHLFDGFSDKELGNALDARFEDGLRNFVVGLDDRDDNELAAI